MSLSGVTLLLITRERLVRADFTNGRSPVLKALEQRPRPDTDDLETLLDTAIRLGKGRLGKVYVLSSDFWMQSMHMAADLARGLDEVELARALCFEAEPLSGISAFDSQAAVTALASSGQQRDFWIVQIPNSQLTQADDVIHQAGGKLQGLSHPAGLGRALTPGRDNAWQRVELWPGSIVCRRQTLGAPPQVQVINSEPAQRGWQPAVEAWLGDSAPALWLIAESSIKSPAENTGVFSLADEPSLRTWLSAWAEQLVQQPAGVPIVRPARRPMSQNTRRAITAALAVAAGLGGFAHYTIVERHIKAVSEKTAAINSQIASFEAMKKQGTELTGKIDKAQKQLDTLTDKLEDCQLTLDAHRLRWENLLLLLAAFRPDDMVVQKIESNGDRLKISGLCLGPHPANELASELNVRVRDLGWGVQPARQVSGEQFGSGEPWKFDLVLTNVAAAQVLPASMTKPAVPSRPNPLPPPPNPRLQPIPRRPPGRVASRGNPLRNALMPSDYEDADEAQD